MRMDKDIAFMRDVLALASRAEGNTSPNPLVGAVIVDIKGRRIASGYHKKAGMPHAEVEAISRAGRSCRGATLYVNLEPCRHWGRTPPCTDAIIRAGIRRVVVAVKDPNPAMSGRSLDLLRKKGIMVSCGILQKEARRLNEIFFKNMEQGLPWISGKIAQTLDGKTATSTGDSFWITGEKARAYARRLRGIHDAVLIGINTVLKDDPLLDIPQDKDFTKVVLDYRLRVRPDSRIFQNRRHRVIIVVDQAVFKKSGPKIKILRRQGDVRFLAMPGKACCDIRKLAQRLYADFSIRSVFVEGGSETLGRCFDARAVDKLYFFMAPKIIGGRHAFPSVGGNGIRRIKDATVIKDVTVKKIGNDFLFTGYPLYGRR